MNNYLRYVMKVFVPYKYMIKALYLSLFLLITNCNSTKSVVNVEAMSELETVLNTRNYRVDIRAVFPFNTAATQQVINNVLTNRVGNTTSRIDVVGDGFFMAFNDSIAKAYLPYYGEQQLIGGRYGGNDMGVEFNATPQKYNISKHKRKDAYVIKFEVKDEEDRQESYKITMTVFPNYNTEILVLSSHRTANNYRGILKPYETGETAL
ncbi:MAG: hypothetical protein Wins2KO_03950 [Winogradskyella sp.]